MNIRLTKFVDLAGNASQIIIAGSILAELFFKLRERKNTVAELNPNDDGEDSPSPSTSMAA